MPSSHTPRPTRTQPRIHLEALESRRLMASIIRTPPTAVVYIQNIGSTVSQLSDSAEVTLKRTSNLKAEIQVVVSTEPPPEAAQPVPVARREQDIPPWPPGADAGGDAGADAVAAARRRRRRPKLHLNPRGGHVRPRGGDQDGHRPADRRRGGHGRAGLADLRDPRLAGGVGLLRDAQTGRQGRRDPAVDCWLAPGRPGWRPRRDRVDLQRADGPGERRESRQLRRQRGHLPAERPRHRSASSSPGTSGKATRPRSRSPRPPTTPRPRRSP